jgi:hypothetical protein
MRIKAVLFCVLFFSIAVTAQQGFRFEPDGKKKTTISFKLINNLIIVPVSVNGTKLNFLLDTGVDETILFSLDDKDEVSLFNVEKIKLKGLGSNEAVEGLKSSHNKIAFAGYADPDHDIYIVLDQDFNFSSSIGIPVNGIIGYQFFKNHVVEVDYDRRKIIVYNGTKKSGQAFARNFKPFDISVEDNKPYTISGVAIAETIFSAKLLIDTGNTDALWLFEDKSALIRVPEKNFEDFLGRGLSGDIHGKRARITKFQWYDFAFTNPLAAFPDSTSTKHIQMAENRFGSLGGEILKRFNVAFDYAHNKIFLRKGNNYDMPFYYNMSGLEIQHEGMTWVKEEVELHPVKKYDLYKSDAEAEKSSTQFTYKFQLKPVFSISNVRKSSPAELCGLKKGDVLVSVNGTSCYRYSLQDINTILKSEEGKLITIEVERNKQVMKFSFRLKSIL